MNYTENYHLPQWVKEDRIMMDDFNQMCAGIEAGLTKNAGDAAQAVANASKEALAAAASANANAVSAQSTANTALAKANAAYSPSKQPYVVGTYTGNGDTLTVTLEFQPKFLLISAQHTVGGYDLMYPTGFVLAGSGAKAAGVTILNNGFTVLYTTINNSACPPGINNNGVTYAYIAFR
ncbi:MAG: hypothetical protein K2O45_11650 [Oscillospiraceae bacterium]|nr:hypothetical protein [Oscillospiraceae bacterium]